ncbi:MAG TPA: YtxH domain-containing protein [Candidatus Paceibacterota bacterium]|nr:YtxH domain-containing protein [Candidatus Paceibacterota bacterium]
MIKKKSNKTSKNSGKLLEGALVGATLGIAAGMLLAPESGKKMRRDIKKLSGDFYRHIAPQVKKMKKVGEAQYNELVAKGATNYAKAKKLSLSEQKALIAEAKRSWGHIKKHLR